MKAEESQHRQMYINGESEKAKPKQSKLLYVLKLKLKD
jgi:hypothetical protein